MTFLVPAMWSVWGLLVLAVLGLKIYSGRLSRDEDDQLVLADAFSHVKDEQAAIVAKVHKVEPIQRATLWVLGAMSLFIIAYYILDIINQFKV